MCHFRPKERKAPALGNRRGLSLRPVMSRQADATTAVASTASASAESAPREYSRARCSAGKAKSLLVSSDSLLP